MNYNLIGCRLRRIVRKWKRLEDLEELTGWDREIFYQLKGNKYRSIAEQNYRKARGCVRFVKRSTGEFESVDGGYNKFFREFKKNLERARKSSSQGNGWRT